MAGTWTPLILGAFFALAYEVSFYFEVGVVAPTSLAGLYRFTYWWSPLCVLAGVAVSGALTDLALGKAPSLLACGAALTALGVSPRVVRGRVRGPLHLYRTFRDTRWALRWKILSCALVLGAVAAGVSSVRA